MKNVQSMARYFDSEHASKVVAKLLPSNGVRGLDVFTERASTRPKPTTIY
jgi:hypothetical protein